MVNDEFIQKVDKLKEDLIYAVNEKYEGELEIEDVTSSTYHKMILNQDKKVIDNSSYFYAEAASKIIESLEEYLKDLGKFNRRTIFRNSEIIEDTLNDLYQTTEIFILSIRKNNASWQAKLDSYIDPRVKNEINNMKKDSLEYNLFNLINSIKMDEGDDDGNEEN